jgi:MerR family transcriptional regulator, redox-sensitive transcriptional activator SoxR
VACEWKKTEFFETARIIAMTELTISQVAKQAGLRPSAIRYYEKVGILPRAPRTSGQRRFDTAVLYRLALVQRARQMGFTLDEIQRLFFGFRKNTPISERWKKLSTRKLAELDMLAGQVKTMQELLRGMATKCSCDALDQCGKAIFQNSCEKNRTLAPARVTWRNR